MGTSCAYSRVCRTHSRSVGFTAEWSYINIRYKRVNLVCFGIQQFI